MRFSETYPGESVNNSVKILIHWKALEIDVKQIPFWQIALVGYILPRQRHRRSLFLDLFRENWGGDHSRGRSIVNLL